MRQDHRIPAFDSVDDVLAAAVEPGLKFSIVTACKNNSSTIEGCMASVAEQTYSSVEHVVVDCASKDDSIERIYAQRDRLSIIYGREDDSRFMAWNRGIGQASGDVLGFVDGADALANADVLTRVAEAFSHPWVSAVYGDVLCVHPNDTRHILRSHNVGEFSPKKLRRGWAPPTSSLFVRRSWYRRIGGFSTQMKVAADYDASLRLFSHRFFKAAYLREPVVRRRVSPLSARELRMALLTPFEELQALRTSQLGGWRALTMHNISKLGHWL